MPRGTGGCVVVVLCGGWLSGSATAAAKLRSQRSGARVLQGYVGSCAELQRGRIEDGDLVNG